MHKHGHEYYEHGLVHGLVHGLDVVTALCDHLTCLIHLNEYKRVFQKLSYIRVQNVPTIGLLLWRHNKGISHHKVNHCGKC